MIGVSVFLLILMSILLNSSTTSRPGLYLALWLLSLAAGGGGCFLFKRNHARYREHASPIELKKLRTILLILGSSMMIIVSLFFIAMMIIVLNSSPSHPGADIAIMVVFLATGMAAFSLLKTNFSRYRQANRTDSRPHDRSSDAP
jgi:hypothetical protein